MVSSTARSRMPKHHIIYLPGFGDPRSLEKTAVEKLWRIFGVTAHHHTLYWHDDVSFDVKLEAVLKQIDELKAAGHTVSLVGTSAGASVAIDAFAKRPDKISGVVCICGKLRNSEKIGETYYKKYPAFRGSIDLLYKGLDSLGKANRQRIMSIRPIFDEIVPVKDTCIDNAKSKLIPVVGHLLGITYSITFGARAITKFLKSQALLSS